MFDETRGYGFVTPDSGGEDAFVHVNDLDFDKNLVAPGVQVEFVAEESDRGLKASSVRLLDASTAASAPPVPPVPPVPAWAARPVAGQHRADGAEDLADPQDDTCDVLSEADLAAEVTERLLAAVPTLTGAQILAARGSVVALAKSHGWTD